MSPNYGKRLLHLKNCISYFSDTYGGIILSLWRFMKCLVSKRNTYKVYKRKRTSLNKIPLKNLLPLSLLRGVEIKNILSLTYEIKISSELNPKTKICFKLFSGWKSRRNGRDASPKKCYLASIDHTPLNVPTPCLKIETSCLLGILDLPMFRVSVLQN